MRLIEFQVTSFRNIADSGPIAVDEKVTCLVGKNESGKTALLEALRRVKPDYPAPFDPSEHYPRWRWAPDRRRGQVEGTHAVRAVFKLDPEDVAAVEERFGTSVLKGDELIASVGYETRETELPDVDERRAIEHVLDLLVEADDPRRAQFASAEKLADFIEQIDSGIAAAETETAADSDDDAPSDASQTEETSGAEWLQQVRREVGDWPNRQALVDAIVEKLEPRVPRFFYFSNYSILPGRLDLEELATEDAEPGQDAMQTARALLKLAGTDHAMLGEEEYEHRKAEMEAVSNDLTRQMEQYWHQSKDLEVDIDVDKVTQQRPTGEVVVARFLDVRVKDRRHGYTNNFSQRSSGFKWFFSFLAAFSEFEDLDEPVIVLLDEPGLTLHGRAQSDFLRFIEERLAPAGQVIYTTHSPFMVDPAELDRVRIVEDRGGDEGSVTTSEVLAVDRDSLFPLQAALGYDVAQSLFIGPDNILVEGTSDWTYLTVLSDHLKTLKREGLDERWRVLPTGGAQNIPAFVALLGQHLDVTVLVDAGTQGMQRLQTLATRGLLSASRLVTVAQITGAKHADIEDLFAVEDYLTLYNAAFKRKLTAKGLPAGDRILGRIAAKTGDEFDHGRPADELLRHRGSFLDGLVPGTLDNFESVFKRLNATAAP